MRIALVSETWPPEINGVALTIQSLALGMVSLGHQVEVIRPRQRAKGGAEPTRIVHFLVRGAPLPRYRGLQIGLPNPGELARHLRASRPDAIYVATEGPLGRSAVLTARKLAIPVCTGFHTRFDDFVRHYGAACISPIVFAWMRRFHNAADATAVPTNELATFLSSRGFPNVQLLRWAVSTHQFDPARRDLSLRAEWGLHDRQLAVLHVGRIAAEKNLVLATRAFHAIQQARSDAKFVIVGDGPTREEWASENPDFIFAGTRRGDDLGRHCASADLFLFPSLSETLGNVTLEAMASGLATVAFDYAASHEHINNGLDGICIRRDDESGFIDAAVRLARADSARLDMGERARRAVATLDPATPSSAVRAVSA